MTYTVFVSMWCDWPTCYGRFDSHRTKVTDARKDAEQQGWRHVSGMDFCGLKEKADQYSTCSQTWSGCAESTSHLPDIKIAGGGSVKLGCSCGWTYENRYSWERPGEVARTSADYCWQQHIKSIKDADR